MFKFKDHARPKAQKNKFNLRFAAWIVLSIIIAVGFIWGGETLRNPDNFPIERVKIIAPYEHITPKMLQEVIGAFATRGFFGLDVISLKQRLLALPWVYAVVIKREWPDTIVISIFEQKAVAEWNNEALLNQEGGIFRPAKESFPNKLPLLSGTDADAAQVWTNYQNMQTELNPLHFNIAQLNLDSQGFWHAILNDGEEMFISYNNPLARLQDFIAAYPKIIESHHANHWRSIDLRYEDGVAIKW